MWIEAQLAHKDSNEIRDTYNHAKYLNDRRAMMQTWADYLDALKQGKDTSSFKHGTNIDPYQQLNQLEQSKQSQK